MSRRGSAEAPARDRRLLDEHAVGVLRVAGVVARVRRRRAAEEVRVDVPRASRRPHGGVKAERRQVRVDRRGPVGEPEPAVRLDPGMLCREPRRHHGRLAEREQLEPSVRRRQRDDERARLRAQRVLAGSERECRTHGGRVQSERSEPRRVDRDRPSRRGDGFRCARPEGLRAVDVDGPDRLAMHGARPDNRRRGCDSQNQPDQGGEARTGLSPRTAALIARAGHCPPPI